MDDLGRATNKALFYKDFRAIDKFCRSCYYVNTLCGRKRLHLHLEMKRAAPEQSGAFYSKNFLPRTFL